MRIAALDEETELIRVGLCAPPPACMTYELLVDGVRSGSKIVHWTAAEPLLREWLTDHDTLIVGQNIPYDLAVAGAQWPHLIPLIFQAYEEDRITDTMIRQQLLDIASGCFRGKFDTDGTTWIKYGYGLFDLSRRLTGKLLKKDGWRLRYGEFRDVPLDQWVAKAKDLQVLAAEAIAAGSEDKDLAAILLDPPEQVIQYPLDDASTTMDCFLKQEPAAAEYLKSQFHEARAAWVQHLASCWGMRTDPAGVEELRRVTEEELRDIKARLVAAGLVREDGSRDTKKAQGYMEEYCLKEGLPIRRTKTGGISLDEEACLATEDALLLDYAKFTGLNKALDSDYPMLFKGTVYPVHTRFGIAGSSRATSSNPNLQNVSKK